MVEGQHSYLAKWRACTSRYHRLPWYRSGYSGTCTSNWLKCIWHSREQFEAFGKRLMPILAAAGIQFASPPDIFEVHNVVKG